MTDAAFLAWLQSADCLRCALVEVVAAAVLAGLALISGASAAAMPSGRLRRMSGTGSVTATSASVAM